MFATAVLSLLQLRGRRPLVAFMLAPFFRTFSCSGVRLNVLATAGAFTALIRAAGRGRGALSRNLS